MENKRLFIGNLDFSATAGEVQSLLSRFGTVVSVTLKQKKGYAFVEMETSEAAAQAVQQLEGTHHRGRIMRLSLEMKARKARTVSAKRYKERGAALGSRKLHGEESAKRPRPADKPAHASRPDRGSSRPGPSRPVKAESGYTPRERTNAPVFGRSSSSPRGTSGPARPHQKARFPKRPAHSMSASGDRLTERPQSSTTVTPKPRTYAHARSSNATGHQPGNRARPGAGARKGAPASSGPKHRGTAAGFNKPRRRD
jgi:RNA recognition motif-containing protein